MAATLAADVHLERAVCIELPAQSLDRVTRCVRPMELCCADSESTLDYCRATQRYLARHATPMAF